MVLAALKTGSDLTYGLPPTYHLCQSLSIPTPLICNTTNLASLYFFFLSYDFVSLTPFIVLVRLTYHVNLANPQPIKALSGGE